ncbi:MAG: RagB/SusD family nutrient uptake outer membrane protein [Bacteroidaceae bacterium]|nr:RagB/SusD family nutrient uptake outer membrane protein [Bacteroidaceae bacterium]
MKKNKIFSLLAAASLLITVPSCTDLDERIYDQLPAESFGSTATEINALVGTCYNTLKRLFPDDCLTMSEGSGSVMIYPTRIGGDWWDGGQYMQMFMHTYTNMTSCNRGAWNAAMESIGTCNANLNTVLGSDMPDKDQKAAEIRGIRAYWYYFLVNGWGNVPMVIDYNDKELPTNSSRADAYNWLVGEVNSLVSALPEADGNYGKFTKASAHALLAKLYLNAEAWGMGSKYAEAASEAALVINDPGLELLSNWKDNFSWNNSGNRESILSAQYSSSDTRNTNYVHIRCLGYVENLAIGGTFGAWNGFCAQPDYVKLFMHDPSKASDPTYTYYDDPENDPRIASFRLGMQKHLSTGEILLTGKNLPMNHYAEVFPLNGTEKDGTLWREVQQQDGGRVGKWEYVAGLSGAMNNDYAIFRLADFYLVRAEALLRSGGDVAEATRLVNTVRARAWSGNPNYKPYAAVTLADVQLERRLELAWEGVSREDDIRFGCYDKDMWSMFRAGVGNELDDNGMPKSLTPNTFPWARKSDKYLELFPIPFSAWQTNPNLVQNPGYPAFN